MPAFPRCVSIRHDHRRVNDPLVRRGVSYLELVIVLLIIGLLAAVGTPRFATTLRVRNARHAAIQLTDYVNFVRVTAMSQGRATSLSVDPAVDRFFSDDVEFPDRPGTLISLLLKQTHDDAIELSADFDDANVLTFDLEGMPYVGANRLSSGVIEIEVSTVRYRITIDPGTGVATVQEVAVGSGDLTSSASTGSSSGEGLSGEPGVSS